MNTQCARWLWWAMSFVLHICMCPAFSLSTPFHLVSVQVTVWCLLPPDSSSSFPWYIPSLSFSHLYPSGFHIQPLYCYSSVRPLKHSLGAVLINPWPLSRSFKFSLKCCLIFGFNKLVWSMLVATTFSWKSVGFWPSPFLCMSMKLQMGETNPAPSIASLKKSYCSLKPSGYKLLHLWSAFVA